MKQTLIYSLLLSLICSVAMGQVQTVPSVDLQKYRGQWFEIAAIPQEQQKDCVSDVSAQYTQLPEGLLKVRNSCKTKTGKIQEAIGRARVVDEKSNAKLEVTFAQILFRWAFPFGGDYWILDVAEDYSYAVVGEPSAESGWILSRSKTLSEEHLERAKDVLQRNGYNVCDFRFTIQDGGATENKSLCD